jgi:phosphate butyryltransferase
MINFFDELHRQTIKLVEKKKPPSVAIITDKNQIAVQSWAGDEISQPIFINPDNTVSDKATDMNDALSRVIRMAGDKQIDVIVLDEKYLTEFLKLARDKSSGFVKFKGFLSHASVFEHEVYHKLFMFCDAFVNSHPTLDEKVNIIKNAVTFSKTLGVDLPKVAILAAVEKVYHGMAVTIEAEKLKSMNIAGEIVNCIIDGPLSMDCAMIKKVAVEKGVDSEVAGDPDILVAPDINAANAIYHAISRIGLAKTGSLIIGGSVPVVLLHINDKAENAINSLTLGSYYSLNSDN